MTGPRTSRRVALPAFVFLLGYAAAPAAEPVRGLDFDRLAALRQVREIAISPSGDEVAFTLQVPRRPGRDDDGPVHNELHWIRQANGPARPFVQGEVDVSSIAFSPDGGFVTFLGKRGTQEHRALWAIPTDGGEARAVLEFDSDLEAYALSPDGDRVAFVAADPEPEERKGARDKGYEQEVFEEDWRPWRVWTAPVELRPAAPRDPALEAGDEASVKPRAFELAGSAVEVGWSPAGDRLAVAVAPRPLIDDRTVQQRVKIVGSEEGRPLGAIENAGKLGRFQFAPEGKRIALISAADPHDPSAGRLLVAAADGGVPQDALPGLEADVLDFAWRGPNVLLYVAHRGAESFLGEVDLATGRNRTHWASGAPGVSGPPLARALRLSADGRRGALVGDRPSHPAELFTFAPGRSSPERRTESNPWLAEVELGPQEVVRHSARDGVELEGVLLRPLAGTEERPWPLLLMVHGGPESHDSNGWVTSYSRPGQLAAARGYAVFYPNYRGSTGRGVAFSKLGQGDAAGAEFDDLVDAVDHLVAVGIADRERVGITGGSYGGYATAWCSTRHSERFRAGVMFVGISNELSKGLTTEIPVEDRLVHTLDDPWTSWQFRLERSPIYHAEKSRTALLIAGGTADTRVHPSQSLQLYRALKGIGKTPVRYVRYPGEGHGNRKAAARDDYSRRLMQWMDHFVKERREGLPPWEVEIPALGAGKDGKKTDDED